MRTNPEWTALMEEQRKITRDVANAALLPLEERGPILDALKKRNAEVDQLFRITPQHIED